MSRFKKIVKKIKECHRTFFETVKDAVINDKLICIVSVFNNEEQEAMLAVMNAWETEPVDIRHTDIRFKITDDLKKNVLGLMKAEKRIQRGIASYTLNAARSVDLFKFDLSFIPWYLAIYEIPYKIKGEWLTFRIPRV